MGNRTARLEVLAAVLREMEAQEGVHGPPEYRDITAAEWLTILVEEIGEVASAIQEDDFGNLQTELIQVAAVSSSFASALVARSEVVRAFQSRTMPQE